MQEPRRLLNILQGWLQKNLVAGASPLPQLRRVRWIRRFFYGQESADAVAYHKSASALGGLTDIKDIAPLVEFLVTDGWWITGQTIFANGGYTTR